MSQSGDPAVSSLPKTSSFPHSTSPDVVTRKPYIDTSTPAINDAPVELDGIPTSPDELRAKEVLADGAGRKRQSLISPSLDDEEDINGEFLGEGKGEGRSIREKRAAILASRSKDPGVIVDVPKDPTAEEVEAAKIADGTTTPAVQESDGKR